MSHTIPWQYKYKNEPAAIPGMTAIQGDEWPSASAIIPGDSFDQKLFDTDLRYDRSYCTVIPSLPVKIQVTGRVLHSVGFGGHYKIRCLINTWDSNEERVTFRGWLFLWSNYEDVQ